MTTEVRRCTREGAQRVAIPGKVCPNCRGELGLTELCLVCARYAILEDPPSEERLLQERADLDLMGSDLEAYREHACKSGPGLRQWLNGLSSRKDLAARAVQRAWVDLAATIDANAPQFFDLLDRGSVAEYELMLARRQLDEYWEEVKVVRDDYPVP